MSGNCYVSNILLLCSYANKRTFYITYNYNVYLFEQRSNEVYITFNGREQQENLAQLYGGRIVIFRSFAKLINDFTGRWLSDENTSRLVQIGRLIYFQVLLNETSTMAYDDITQCWSNCWHWNIDALIMFSRRKTSNRHTSLFKLSIISKNV